MKIVCAASVLYGREAFGTLGEAVVVPDREITADTVRDADLLVVRSKTRVDARLLDGTAVGFVGTATAGTDHMDVDYLNDSDIAWCAAPGCNANSVSEYVFTALLCLAHRHPAALDAMTMGVIGVGNVGQQVVRKAQGLGLRVLQNDPPLGLATRNPVFLPLDDVLRQADLLTLHVPLTDTGPFPTFHMANCHFFEHVKPGCILLNTSRGEVVETDALLYAREAGTVRRMALDVWEGEPFIPEPLLDRADIGTPHIAGYSFEGRLSGTVAVYNEACHFLEVETEWVPDEKMFPAARQMTVNARGKSDEAVLWEIAHAAYDIEADDSALRRRPAGKTERAVHFDALRRNYPERREFTASTIRLVHGTAGLAAKISTLGFRVKQEG